MSGSLCSRRLFASLTLVASRWRLRVDCASHEVAVADWSGEVGKCALMRSMVCCRRMSRSRWRSSKRSVCGVASGVMSERITPARL